MGGVASHIPIVGSLLGGGVHPAEALAMHEHLRKGKPMGRGRKWNTFRRVVLDKHPELMDVPTKHLTGGGFLPPQLSNLINEKVSSWLTPPKVKAARDAQIKQLMDQIAATNAKKIHGGRIRKRRGRGAFMSRPRRPPVLLDPDTLKPLPRPKRSGGGIGPVRLNPAYEHSYVGGGLF